MPDLAAVLLAQVGAAPPGASASSLARETARSILVRHFHRRRLPGRDPEGQRCAARCRTRAPTRSSGATGAATSLSQAKRPVQPGTWAAFLTGHMGDAWRITRGSEVRALVIHSSESLRPAGSRTDLRGRVGYALVVLPGLLDVLPGWR